MKNDKWKMTNDKWQMKNDEIGNGNENKKLEWKINIKDKEQTKITENKKNEI